MEWIQEVNHRYTSPCEQRLLPLASIIVNDSPDENILSRKVHFLFLSYFVFSFFILIFSLLIIWDIINITRIDRSSDSVSTEHNMTIFMNSDFSLWKCLEAMNDILL